MWLPVIQQIQNGAHGNYDILMERKMEDVKFAYYG